MENKERYIFDREKLPRPVIEGHDDWVDLYYEAWKTAFDNVEYIDRPGWKNILTCMPGVGITWQWDACIMTFITNYSNGTLSAFNNLDNLYRLRREDDGFMSMAYEIEKECEAYPGRINPPLMAWAEWEHYLVSGDSSRFEKVLPALEGLYSFIEKNRTRESCGLYWFEDPGSSGMDNSPRGGYMSDDLDGSDLCHIDLACQQVLSAQNIANMHEYLGNAEKADFYRKDAERITALINKYHWSEKAGWYFDFFIRNKAEEKVKYVNSKTAAAFWSLISNVARNERKEKVKNHLFNENEFYTKVPFASLSKDDPNYDETGGYWLGSVWPPVEFAAIKGLSQRGYRELAREATVKLLTSMAHVANDPAFGSIWECYAPEAYRPATTEDGSLVRYAFVGWGGMAPITLLIENIIGLNFDAPSNTVKFYLDAHAPAGLENMMFNNNNISVKCTCFKPFRGESIIETKAEKAFTLIVHTGYLWEDVTINVTPGENTYRV